MTAPVAAPTRGRLLLGAVLALVGHALAIGATILAAHLYQPKPGGGFDDLAAALSTFLISEIVLLLVCVIGGSVLLVWGRRDLGVGLLSGWAAGGIALFVFILVLRNS